MDERRQRLRVTGELEYLFSARRRACLALLLSHSNARQNSADDGNLTPFAFRPDRPCQPLKPRTDYGWHTIVHLHRSHKFVLVNSLICANDPLLDSVLSVHHFPVNTSNHPSVHVCDTQYPIPLVRLEKQ